MRIIRILFYVFFLEILTNVSIANAQSNKALIEVSTILNKKILYTYITNVSKRNIELSMCGDDNIESRFSLYCREGNMKILKEDNRLNNLNGKCEILISPGETKLFVNILRKVVIGTSSVNYNITCKIFDNSNMRTIKKNVDLHNIIGLSGNKNDVSISGELVYSNLNLDQMSKFPGGDSALMHYISRNLEYPKSGIGNITRVILGAIIEKDGTMSHLHIVRSEGKELDSLALKVFQNPPRWISGFKDGKPVRVYLAFPVMFRER